MGSRRPFRIGLLTGTLAIIVVLGIQLVLLRELSVFNTGLGLWVLATEFVSTAALLLALVFVGSFFSARIQRQSGSRTPLGSVLHSSRPRLFRCLYPRGEQ